MRLGITGVVALLLVGALSSSRALAQAPEWVANAPDGTAHPNADGLLLRQHEHLELDEQGKVTGAVHSQGGQKIECERVPPYDPGPEVLQEYQGRYLSKELETFYNLELRDSTLVVLIRNTEPVKLDSLKVDLYKGDVFFLTEVQFMRDEAGAVTGFEASNGRTKGIRFERY